MPLKLTSSGGGSVTLDVPSTASDFTATMPANTGTVITTGSTAAVTQGMLASGVVGNGPAFRAVSAANQTVTNNVVTKVTLDTENFDTASCFTNSRFTPNVAGYYYLTGIIASDSTTGVNTVLTEAKIYINGNASGWFGTFQYSPTYPFEIGVSHDLILVYLNGTTDYAELYGRAVVNSGTPRFLSLNCVFSGFLARAA